MCIKNSICIISRASGISELQAQPRNKKKRHVYFWSWHMAAVDYASMHAVVLLCLSYPAEFCDCPTTGVLSLCHSYVPTFLLRLLLLSLFFSAHHLWQVQLTPTLLSPFPSLLHYSLINYSHPRTMKEYLESNVHTLWVIPSLPVSQPFDTYSPHSNISPNFHTPRTISIPNFSSYTIP